MEIIEVKRNVSITRSNEFKKRKLASHAPNVGLLCGHGCLYCSTPAMMRTHTKIFKNIKSFSFKAFQAGIAVVDPQTPKRIALRAHRLEPSDTVMFCTYTDGWSPEAKKFQQLVYDSGKDFKGDDRAVIWLKKKAPSSLDRG